MHSYDVCVRHVVHGTHSLYFAQQLTLWEAMLQVRAGWRLLHLL